jgi:pyruvate decarboxylase
MQWQYYTLPYVFAQDALKDRIKTWRLRSRQELDSLFNDESFAKGKGLQFVEIHMPKLDASQVLIESGKNAAKIAS